MLSEFEFFFNAHHPTQTDKTSYLKICSDLIEKLQQNECSKVVLSRVEKHEINTSPADVFQKLNQTYFNTFNYLISIQNVGTWLGATPEILAEFNQNEFSTVALAGTKISPNMNWTKKELEEQQMVTDFILRQIHPLVTDIQQSKLETVKAGEVYHLKTTFKANCKVPWTEVIDVLHPTPATCGVPKQKALAIIQSVELHQREFYTGYLGIITPKHKLLMVNLRCMQIIEKSAYLYLGGGITANSNALNEWEETQNKAKTLLNMI